MGLRRGEDEGRRRGRWRCSHGSVVLHLGREAVCVGCMYRMCNARGAFFAEGCLGAFFDRVVFQDEGPIFYLATRVLHVRYRRAVRTARAPR